MVTGPEKSGRGLLLDILNARPFSLADTLEKLCPSLRASSPLRVDSCSCVKLFAFSYKGLVSSLIT